MAPGEILGHDLKPAPLETDAPAPSAKGGRPTVFISAYRNFSIRYLLYSGVLERLIAAGCRVVVFVKDGDIDYYRRRLGDGVICEPVLFEKAMRQVKGSQLANLFILIRKCMSGSDATHENTTDAVRIYQYGQELSSSVWGRLRFLIVRSIAGLGRRSYWFRRLVVGLESVLFRGQLYDEYFRRYCPDMLIVSSVGYMIDPLIMRAGKRHGCQVVSIVHNWDNPTTKDYRGAAPDHVIAWNDLMKEELHVFHDLPNDRISVGGIAHWDFYFDGTLRLEGREAFLASHRLATERKLIFYATSNHVLFRRTFDVIEELLDALARDALACPAQLLVRLHPAYLLRQKGGEGRVVDRFQARIVDLERKYPGLVRFTTPRMKMLQDDIDMPPEDMHSLAEMIFHADVLLTEYSTVMIEGAILDTPVVNVALYNFRDTEKPASYIENYAHIRRILKPGAARSVYAMPELLQVVDRYLNDPTLDRDERRRLVAQEIPGNRGAAAMTVANLLLALLPGVAGPAGGLGSRSA